MENEERKDSFTIGTAATGGSIKVYIDILDTDTTIKKIDEAIRLWKNSKAMSGK